MNTAEQCRDAVAALRANLNKMTRKPQVLIVEDSRSDAEMIRHQIEQECVGMELTITDSCEAASRELSKRAFDFVFLDILFPAGRTGLELLSEIEALPQSPAVIVMSGLDEDEPPMLEAMKRGACAVFRKPFTDHQMRMICGAA